MTTLASDDNLCRRAVAAYYRTATDTMVDQPAGGGDVVEHQDKTYVVLSNVRGTLAVYRVRADGILKRLKRWPAAVADT
jgi:hypothetical protein